MNLFDSAAKRRQIHACLRYYDSLAPPIMHWDSSESDLDPCCERETLGASIVGEQVPLPLQVHSVISYLFCVIIGCNLCAVGSLLMGTTG